MGRLKLGSVQVDGIALRLVIELFDEFKEQMLQLCQALTAIVLQVLKSIFDGLEPLVHSGALVEE